jgi:NhaP-type Na+/H+ or K+/H+ antiporter
MLAKFVIMSLASIVVGVFFGLLCSFVFKKLKGLD